MTSPESRPAPPLQDTAPVPAPEATPRRLPGPVARGLGKIVLTAGRAYERHLDKSLGRDEKDAESIYVDLEQRGRISGEIQYHDRTRQEDIEVRKNNVRDFHRGKRNKNLRDQHATYDIVEDPESLKARENKELERLQAEKGRVVELDDHHDKLLRNSLGEVNKKLTKISTLEALEEPTEAQKKELKELLAVQDKLLAKQRSLGIQLDGKMAPLKPRIIPMGTPAHKDALPSSHLYKHRKGLKKAQRSAAWHARIAAKQGEKSKDFTDMMQDGGILAANADRQLEIIDKDIKKKESRKAAVTGRLKPVEKLVQDKSTRVERQNARHERVMHNPVGRKINELNDAGLAFEARLRSKEGRRAIGRIILGMKPGLEKEPEEQDQEAE